MKQYGRLF